MAIKPTTYLNISTDKKVWTRIDIDENSEFAINIAVQDIADFALRKGSGSYKITLANTPQNHRNLKHVFDVKGNDLSLVKKKVYAQVIKNDSLLFDNYYFVLEESELSKDKKVKIYKARIFNEMTNFFQVIDGKLLTDLDLNTLNHVYNSATISNSFNHTYVDSYKYMLPYNWNNTNKYKTSDLFPGIYTKRYFDEIHKQAGYRYTFSEEDAPNIRFKELIHPFTGDLKKLLDGEYKELRSEVKRNTLQQVTITSPAWANQNYSQTNNNFTTAHNMQATQEVYDVMDLWDLGNYTFTNPATFTAPGKLKFNFQINWDVFVTNLTNYQMINWFSASQAMTKETHNALTAYIEVFNSTTNTVIATKRLNPYKIEKGHNNMINTVRDYNNKWYLNGPILVEPNSDKLLYSTNNEDQSFDIEITNVTIGDELKFRLRFSHYSEDNINATWRRADITNNNVIVQHRYKLNVKSFTIKQEVFTDTYLVGNTLNINKFIPAGIKQTEYISSLFNMFNIYAEIDPLDERHIIYKTRNTFYRTGLNRGDLTDKVNFGMSITTKYIPNINEKKVILTYKHDDKDSAQKEYKDTTDEIVAQQEIMFDNENVKGTKTKAISFSPTLNVDTAFGANVPLLPVLPNVNMRILLDNGNKQCSTYIIEDGNNVNTVQRNTYPFLSMQDDVDNPTFSIEYGPSEYYLHNTRFTYNNLFFNHYYNMFEQINNGSIVTLYMHLDDKFISTVKMNDRFTIDNKEYYFNKIIDYKPHVTYTKVELLAADDVLIAPRNIGKRPGKNVKPGISLEDLSVIFVDSENNILDDVFVENEFNDDVDVEAEDTDSNIIHSEVLESKDDEITVLDSTAVVNPGTNAKKDYLEKYRRRNNINNNPSNIVLGIDNIISDDVNNSIIIGDNKTVDISNSLVVDNILTDTINGIAFDKVKDLVNDVDKYKPILRDDLLANIESRSYYITDRDLYATFDSNLKGTYFRILNLPKASEYYDDFKNNRMYSKKDKYINGSIVIYANKLYQLSDPDGIYSDPDGIYIGPGPISITDLDSTCWILQDDMITEECTIIYNYNIITDVFYSAYEPLRRNFIFGLQEYDYSKETQWNAPNTYNNTVLYGIVSNKVNSITNNTCNGFIYLNDVNNITQNITTNINENIVNGDIKNNYIVNDISNVTVNGGSISNNIAISINNTTVQQYIMNNILTGYINGITDIVTYISYNRCNNITNPTLISGAITETPIDK